MAMHGKALANKAGMAWRGVVFIPLYPSPLMQAKRPTTSVGGNTPM
jgi:hypothetical protein